MTPREPEECAVCHDHTGKAGPGDGSLYCVTGESGPLCQRCYDEHRRVCDDGCRDE